MDDLDSGKRAAGRAAAQLVEDGMVLGLGTGSTARWFIEAVGELVASGMSLSGVPTSLQSEAQARAAGIPLVELGRRGVDLAVDGADSVDPDLRLVKGLGGALVREKIVAAAARVFVVVVDAGKLHERLRGPVPVEVVQFGWEATLAALEPTGAVFQLRPGRDGAPLISDNGNLIADGAFRSVEDPEGLAEQIEGVPGVVGHGLFLGMADLVIAGHPDGGVERREAGVQLPSAGG
ncbi:MAG TPA: ribose-5-phosphate isomerase RpiA [Candidatus Angelobacter sp.]|jgi:ribose 5-phosphate isomerase A|nr:ribose-5-phosphate isomerase RpiA [Candidatus Angelobacter sp.]